MIKTTILVEPTPKGRPRLTTIKGQARAFTPAKTRNAETAIQYILREQLKETPMLPKTLPLALSVTFYRPRPDGLRKSTILPIARPDLSNYVKLVEDALNKFSFPDDSQITTIHARKRFVGVGEVPRIELEITEDNGL